MAKGYWIARVDVADAEAYKAYVAANAGADREVRRSLPGPRRSLREPGGRQPQRATSCSSSRRTRPRSTATARPSTRRRSGSGCRCRPSTWSSSRATTGRSPADPSATFGSRPIVAASSALSETRHVPQHPALHRRRLVRRRLRPHPPGRQSRHRRGDRHARLGRARRSRPRARRRRQGLRDLEEGLGLRALEDHAQGRQPDARARATDRRRS